MKINLVFADTQRELAETAIEKLKTAIPGAIVKRESPTLNPQGILYHHVRLDDGKRW